tara:strand:- start:126 stop:971 length:846 start_codon:yes stop_codon:yes gene_type:complete
MDNFNMTKWFRNQYLNEGYSPNKDPYIKVTEPRFIKDKNNPNFLFIRMDYDTGPGGSSIALGKETMTGQIRRLSSQEAMRQANEIAFKLEKSFNLEDIEVQDLENGTVEIFAVSDDFIDMDPKSELSMALLNEMKLNEIHPKSKELVDDYSMGELKDRLSQLYRDMEQEAEPEGGPISDQYADEITFHEDAIRLKKGDSGREMTYGDMLHKNYPDKYGPGGKELNETSKISKIVDSIKEDKPGLWDNIRAKRASGKSMAKKGSKAYKSAKKAGDKINKEDK